LEWFDILDSRIKYENDGDQNGFHFASFDKTQDLAGMTGKYYFFLRTTTNTPTRRSSPRSARAVSVVLLSGFSIGSGAAVGTIGVSGAA